MNGVLHSEHVISRSGMRFLHESENEDNHSLALRSAGVAFLSTTECGAKALFYKRTPKSWRPDGYVAVSVLQPFGVIQFFCEDLGKECGGRSSWTHSLWRIRNTDLPQMMVFHPAYALLNNHRTERGSAGTTPSNMRDTGI